MEVYEHCEHLSPSLRLSQVRCWCLQVNQLSRWSQTTWTGRSQCSTLLLRPACTRCTSSTTAHTSQVSTQHTHTHWLVNRIRWKGDTWCPERELQPLRRRPALRMFGHWSQSENEIWSLMFLLYWYCVFVLQSLLFSSMWTTPVVPVSQPTVLVWATASPTRWRRSPSSQMTPLKVRQLQEEEQSWSSDSSRSWGDSEQEFYFSKSVKTSWFKCTLSICLSVQGVWTWPSRVHPKQRSVAWTTRTGRAASPTCRRCPEITTFWSNTTAITSPAARSPPRSPVRHSKKHYWWLINPKIKSLIKNLYSHSVFQTYFHSMWITAIYISLSNNKV